MAFMEYKRTARKIPSKNIQLFSYDAKKLIQPIPNKGIAISDVRPFQFKGNAFPTDFYRNI